MRHVKDRRQARIARRRAFIGPGVRAAFDCEELAAPGQVCDPVVQQLNGGRFAAEAEGESAGVFHFAQDAIMEARWQCATFWRCSYSAAPRVDNPSVK